MNIKCAQVLDEIRQKLKADPQLVQVLYDALVNCAESYGVEPMMASAVARSFLEDTLDCKAEEVY
jgi:hypothetical protein